MSFTYQYWRLNITGNDSAGSAAVTICEWKFYDGGGSPISTSGGTASANSDNANSPNAFDSNGSTFWAGGQPSYAVPRWLQYQFASSVTVGSYSITCRSDGFFGQSPSSWSLQGSSDGSTWTTIGNYCATAWLSAGQVQTFNVGSFGLNSTAYRLLITADASNQNCSINEWKLYDGSSVQIPTPVGASGADPSGGASSASTTFNASASAFDGSSSTFWASNNAGGHPSGGSPEWLAYQFSATPSTVASFSLTSRNDGFYGQTPSAFSLEKSTDGGATWATVGSSYTATWTAANQVQTFTVTGAGAGGFLINRGMDGGMRPLMKGGMNG